MKYLKYLMEQYELQGLGEILDRLLKDDLDVLAVCPFDTCWDGCARMFPRGVKLGEDVILVGCFCTGIYTPEQIIKKIRAALKSGRLPKHTSRVAALAVI